MTCSDVIIDLCDSTILQSLAVIRQQIKEKWMGGGGAMFHLFPRSVRLKSLRGKGDGWGGRADG